jgi:hypothetical protein
MFVSVFSLISAPAAARAQQAAPHADAIAAIRRQPKDLLDGIVLTKAEKKAVYGIIRRNKKLLDTLEVRDRAAATPGADETTFEQQLAALRDKERTELRAILSRGQRVVFDRNLARLARPAQTRPAAELHAIR